MTRIKICGITNIDDALAAVELGADAIGFVFAESPRRIEPDRAKKIADALPPLVGKVGVFVDEPWKTIRKIADFCGLTVAQLHGRETPAFVKKLGLPVIKAFRVRDRSILDQISNFGLPHFLLDTFNHNQAGGTGDTFDWDIARQAGRFGRVILSGGLNIDNIEEALAIVNPFAVDVSSGVETSPGKKDMQKLETFIKKVRLWDSRTD